jgi:acyl carrier protein
MHDDLRGKLFQFIQGRFPAARRSTMTEDTPLLEGGIVDSLGMLEILTFINRELGIELGDGDLVPENFATIATLARFLEGRSAESKVA